MSGINLRSMTCAIMQYLANANATATATATAAETATATEEGNDNDNDDKQIPSSALLHPVGSLHIVILLPFAQHNTSTLLSHALQIQELSASDIKTSPTLNHTHTHTHTHTHAKSKSIVNSLQNLLEKNARRRTKGVYYSLLLIHG